MIQRQHCLISKQIAVCSICGFVPGLVWCVTLGYQLPKSYEGISTEPESVPVAIEQPTAILLHAGQDDFENGLELNFTAKTKCKNIFRIV